MSMALAKSLAGPGFYRLQVSTPLVFLEVVKMRGRYSRVCFCAACLFFSQLVSTVPSSPLCDRLARLAATLYGLVPVTPEDLQQANPHAAINSEDSATALLKVLGSTACRARGFCLVGFPVLAAHVSLLRRIRKLPTRVVVLVQAQEVDKNKFTRPSWDLDELVGEFSRDVVATLSPSSNSAELISDFRKAVEETRAKKR
eukprot:GHVT01061839.1.p1 GENE.GHVT01061839.1~~GHVT01061839.1.p1  ORF type:complete len:200 (+),score=30.46 GHVT01061839.1:1240-1839(+)